MKGPIFIMVDRLIPEAAYEGPIFIMVDWTIAETAYEGSHIYHGR